MSTATLKPYKQRVSFDIDVPAGYRYVDFRPAKPGEQFLRVALDGDTYVTESRYGSYKVPRVIVEKMPYTPALWPALCFSEGQWLYLSASGDRWWVADKEPTQRGAVGYFNPECSVNARADDVCRVFRVPFIPPTGCTKLQVKR